MNRSLVRAQLFYRQSRYDRAEAELAQALADEPSNSEAHSLLAFCLAARRKYTEATREAEAAIHCAPDSSFAYYSLAFVLDLRNCLDQAELAIGEAIRLNPFEANYVAVAANLAFQQKRWEEALASAERGLAIEPGHARCANLRALSLMRLGRATEASAALAGALAEHPQDAGTHASTGWSRLEQGDPTAALGHFREALRLEPNLDWARQGVVEALKAKNLFYRLMLRYFFFMQSLSDRSQWVVIVGLYLGIQFIQSLAKKNPGWAPVLWPFLGFYVVFALASWIAKPLFNLLLLLNRDGRLALSREERTASLWIGACLVAAIAAVGSALFFDIGSLLIAGMALGLLLVPLSATFHCSEGWPRVVMGLYTAMLAIAGTLIVLCVANDLALPEMLIPGFFLSAIFAPWIGNGLVQILPRRK